MLEFIVVPHATFLPHVCAGCGGSEGPMIDTHRELIGLGRIYVCALCTKRAATALGLVEGKRADELADAAKLLEQAKSEIGERAATQEDLAQKLAERERQILVLSQDNEFLTGRLEQFRTRLREEAQANLELVSD